MPSTSGCHETHDGIDVEAVDSVDGPWLRSSASAGARSKGDRRPVNHQRVRVAALTAEVELLDAERELLDEQVGALTAEVEELEAEVEALERAVESTERQRQQVIDNYEAIVAARSETDGAPDAESAASAETARWRPLAAIASNLERLAARLRRSNE